VELIVLDVDGVLSKGEAQPFDLSLFERLADLNRRARQGEPVPAVTLNTGRPSPYVEAVMQAIDGWQPALYESGAGLYFPQTYQFQTTPLLTPNQATVLQEIVNRLDQTVVQSGRAYWQPGKTICYSLIARPPLTITDFYAEVKSTVAKISDQFVVTPAIFALNIHPTAVNKGTGLQWLAQVTGVDPARIGGVGDSAGDVDFLRLVGYSAAPANVTDEVKAVVRYISPHPDTAGLHDILDHWLTRKE
jgi:hydroxymethylpyrimidine pyrophosphatase-like HAD family hydrolase